MAVKKAYTIPFQLLIALARNPKKAYRLLSALSPVTRKALLGTSRNLIREHVLTRNLNELLNSIERAAESSGKSVYSLIDSLVHDSSKREALKLLAKRRETAMNLLRETFPEAEEAGLREILRYPATTRLRYRLGRMDNLGAFHEKSISLSSDPMVGYKSPHAVHELTHGWQRFLTSPAVSPTNPARYMQAGKELLRKYIEAAILIDAGMAGNPRIDEKIAREISERMVEELIRKKPKAFLNLVGEITARQNPYVFVQPAGNVPEIPLWKYVLGQAGGQSGLESLKELSRRWFTFDESRNKMLGTIGEATVPRLGIMIKPPHIQEAVKQMPGSPLVRMGTTEQLYGLSAVQDYLFARPDYYERGPEILKRLFDQRQAALGLEYLKLLARKRPRTRAGIEILTEQFLREHPEPAVQEALEYLQRIKSPAWERRVSLEEWPSF